MTTHKISSSRKNQHDFIKNNHHSNGVISISFETYNALGVILSKQKKYKDAEQAYRRAIEINPEYGVAYHNFGILLNEKEKFEEINDVDIAALICASAAGYADVVLLLLNDGVNIHTFDKRGRTALIWASAHGHLETVSLLLEKKAEVESVDQDGRTSLIHASRHGHSEVAELLLNKGANIDTTDNDGQSALIWASALGHVQIVNLLLDNGANIYATDSANFVALIWACVNDHIAVAKLLLKNGASIDALDKDERTALIWASASGHLDIVKLLIDYGANIHIADNLGCTAFFWACINNHIEVAKFLLHHGANINPTDKKGHTALMLASERGNNEIVKLLLDEETNFAIETDDQYDPHDEIIEAFLKGLQASHEKYLIIDKVNELDLEIAYLQQILHNIYPYVIERQKYLLKDKLDRAKGKLKDALEEVASIPFPERKELIKKLLVDLEPLKGEAAPPLPDPDLSGNTYPLYIKRTDPFKHLEEVWGKWLVRYNPNLKHSYLNQKQLKERDPIFYEALRNRLNRIPNEHIRDYISPYSRDI